MFRLIASTAARRAAASSSAITPRFFSGAPTSKVKGTVKWFDAAKGYGFLVPDDGSPEVFVHHSAIHAEGFRSLGEEEPVEFEVITEPNGKSKAYNVTGPNGSYVQGAPKRFRNDGYGHDESGGRY